MLTIYRQFLALRVNTVVYNSMIAACSKGQAHGRQVGLGGPWFALQASLVAGQFA